MSTTIIGGKMVVARYVGGLEEQVLIRQLPLRLMPSYADSMGDPASSIALLCDRPVEWTDKLTPESVSEILTIGSEVNSSFFVAHVRAVRMQAALMADVASKSGLQKLP